MVLDGNDKFPTEIVALKLLCALLYIQILLRSVMQSEQFIRHNIQNVHIVILT